MEVIWLRRTWHSFKINGLILMQMHEHKSNEKTFIDNRIILLDVTG